MFLSLNKKFLYPISVFFIIAATIFFSTFYNVYYNKIIEEQRSIFARNQQYITLLYENIRLQKELNKTDQNSIQKYTNELTKEKILADGLLSNYSIRNETIKKGINIILLNSGLLILSMIILVLFLSKFIIIPINKLTETSERIAGGDLSSRIKIKRNKFFFDETDRMASSFNQMADNIQKKITEINKQKNFLQSLIDGIPDALYVIDKKGNIIISNKQYQCLDKKTITRELDTQIFSARGSRKKSVQQFIKDKKHFWLINTALFFTHNDKNKKQPLIVNSIRDLSSDIRFSHQQKISAMGFLATSVAHELKNHLGSIRLLIEALLDKYYGNTDDNDEQKKYLTLIDNQLIQSIKVPERLLHMTKSNPDSQEKTECAETVQEIINLLDFEAKRNNIIITTDLPASGPLLKIPSGDFRIILLNLIQNAFKAMPDNGSIHIKAAAAPDNKITLKISDTGHGIDKENLKHIFEPFFTTDTNHSGSGLGLAIVKSILDNNGGSITVSSIPEKGATFTLTLPLA